MKFYGLFHVISLRLFMRRIFCLYETHILYDHVKQVLLPPPIAFRFLAQGFFTFKFFQRFQFIQKDFFFIIFCFMFV